MFSFHDFFCSTMPRMPPGGNPYDSQQQQGYTIVEDPRAGYFSTATLPSNAALRKPSGPGYVLVIHLLSEYIGNIIQIFNKLIEDIELVHFAANATTS